MDEKKKSGASPPPGADPAAVVAGTYDRLRRIAHLQLRRYRPGQTLNTTAVVHEAYVKLAQEPGAWWHDRDEFFRVAATAMRHLVVDYARRRAAGKRGGDAMMVTLSDQVPGNNAPALDVIALDRALQDLGRLDPALEKVVECRFFAGMTVEETAGALGRPVRTVERDWARARAYLVDILER
jgi:RNA polymerase sigma factor (TIGR02999 family)